MDFSSTSNIHFEPEKSHKEKAKQTPLSSAAQKVRSDPSTTKPQESAANLSSSTFKKLYTSKFRDEADAIMQQQPNGSFLLRPSDNDAKAIVIVRKNPNNGHLEQHKLYPTGKGTYITDPDKNGNITEWNVLSILNIFGEENLVPVHKSPNANWFPPISDQKAEAFLLINLSASIFLDLVTRIPRSLS